MADDVVERVARALYRTRFEGKWSEVEIERMWNSDDGDREYCSVQARAAIAAIPPTPIGISAEEARRDAFHEAAERAEELSDCSGSFIANELRDMALTSLRSQGGG